MCAVVNYKHPCALGRVFGRSSPSNAPINVKPHPPQVRAMSGLRWGFELGMLPKGRGI